MEENFQLYADYQVGQSRRIDDVWDFQNILTCLTSLRQPFETGVRSMLAHILLYITFLFINMPDQ